MHTCLPDISTYEDEFPLYAACPQLEIIRNENSQPDIKIQLGRIHFINAHRIILAARIPQLMNKLKNIGNSSIFCFDEYKADNERMIENFVLYAYTGRINISLENAESVLALSKDFGLSGLLRFCSDFLKDRLSLENVVHILNFTREKSISRLHKICINYMTRNFESFVDSPFLSVMTFEDFFNLIQRDDLCALTEDRVISAITAWSCCKSEYARTRRQLLPLLLSEVRWNEVNRSFRSKMSTINSLYASDRKCNKYLAILERWFQSPLASAGIMCPFNVNPRYHTANQVCESNVLAFGEGIDSENSTNLIASTYNMQNGACYTIGRLKYRLFETVTYLGDDDTLIIGGEVRNLILDDVEVFNSRRRVFRRLEPLNLARSGHGTTVVGNKEFVVCGGWNGRDAFNSCEAYSILQRKWTNLPNMLQHRSVPSVISLPDRRVFVFGGWENGSANSRVRLPSVEMCRLPFEHTESSTSSAQFWVALAPMHEKRSGAGIVSIGCNIFVAGGWDGTRSLSSVEMFLVPNEESPFGQWTCIHDMNQCRNFFSMVPSFERIFAFGNYETPANSVEVLRPKNFKRKIILNGSGSLT